MINGIGNNINWIYVVLKTPPCKNTKAGLNKKSHIWFMKVIAQMC